MFISKQAYQDLKDRGVQLQAQLDAQANANRMLEATLNWFRHRITQIEGERAQLIHHALGVKIPVPVFEKGPDTTGGRALIEQFNEMDIFAGLSDEEARKQGVEWDSEGHIKN